MKSSGYLFLGAAGVALGVGALIGFRRIQRPRPPLGQPQGRWVDLNTCSMPELLDIGLDERSAENIIDERPYRNKMELVSRMIIPEETYEMIHNKIYIAEVDEPVKVAM